MSDELKDQLQKLHERLRNEFRKKWKRSLPFFEEVFDRWERAKFLGFGEKTSIYQNSYVYGDVKVGKNTWIGPFTILDGTGGLTIGDFCSISSGVQIYTHETIEWALTGGKAKYVYAPVSIGDCCFIGSSSVIRMGTKIGNHCLIGADSFVNKNIPDNSIAAGTPVQIIGKVKIKGDAVKFEYFTKEKMTSLGLL